MDNKKLSHDLFIDRLCTIAEKELHMLRTDRGFRHAVAKRLGLGDSTVQRWFHDSFPEAKFLTKIYNEFGVLPDYLIGVTEDSGRGPKESVLDLSQHRIHLGDKVNQMVPPSALTATLDLAAIPMLDQKMISGITTRSLKAMAQYVKSLILVRPDLIQKRTNVVGIHVGDEIGDTMLPVIKPGDVVIVDLDQTDIADGQIYAVDTSTGCVIKIIKICASTGSYVLTPVNMARDRIEALDPLKHKHKIIGKVIQIHNYLP